MIRTSSTDLDYRPSYLAAGITAAAVMLLYLLTLSPSTAMWDTSEYIAAACTLGLPHPPGNPLFVLIGRVFCVLPIAASKAVRINVLAALTGAASAGLWFLIAERVLVAWLAERWQRIAGGVLAALIGATAFTVWNQSVVNEKVYTLSLFGLALISWLTVRWSDDPDGPAADRILVLIAYLLGLGYANHMMGFLAGPAVAVAVIVRRPQTLLRWKLLLVCIAAVGFGITPFLMQPIRAAYFPPINEGEPTACQNGLRAACTFSSQTWDSFMYNFNRGQYGKPPVLERQAPFGAQIGMWWLYFRWQWLRDMSGDAGFWQNLLAVIYLGLGLLGGYVHWKRDRRSFWYLGTLMFTLTLLLIFYLNFKYGYSQASDPADSEVAREVRDRDYFFLVSFSAWGVWAALGLVFFWEWIAELIGSERVKVGRDTLELPQRRSWLIASPVLAFALIPLFGNWHAASRAGQTDTRDFAHDLLESVEPYGVLVTVGDNDTFPLWYAQEVEGIRKDVLVVNTSLLNTDWYTRQLIRRPVFDYDAAAGPAIYRGGDWRKPSGPPLKLTMAQANAVPEVYPLNQPMTFKKDGITAVLQPQNLLRADLLVLQMINDAYPQRPIYFARTSGSYTKDLGLDQYMLTQGLARKLLPEAITPGKDTLLVPGEGLYDLPRSRALWNNVFEAPKSIIRRGSWVDQASVGIPYLYITSALGLAEAEQRTGNATAAQSYLKQGEAIAHATGLKGLFKGPTTPEPLLPLGDTPSRRLGGDTARRP